MVDHQKTLYEVMKRGVDSDQKLNHAYATGLLKKKNSEFFATIILFVLYTICTQKKQQTLIIINTYFIFVAFKLHLGIHFIRLAFFNHQKNQSNGFETPFTYYALGLLCTYIMGILD